MSSERENSFKKCPNCGFQWPERAPFLEDPAVQLIGYQVNFNELEAGLFLFNHSCQTTLAVPAHEFADLYDGPIFTEQKTGSEECPEYCLHQSELRPCTAQCECAFVREIIQIVRRSESL